MSLREKLEATKLANQQNAEQQAEEAKKEAEKLALEKADQEKSILEASQAEAEVEKQQKENAFLDAYSKRGSVKKALEDLRNSKGTLKTTTDYRKQEFRNMSGLVEEFGQEIRKQDPEAQVPSVKDAIAEPKEGTDEARYVGAKEAVKEAVSDVRAKKEVFESIGINIEGLSDSEIEKAVDKYLAEADKLVKEYARNNRNSERPEVLEIRSEMVKQRESELATIFAENFGGTAHIDFINGPVDKMERLDYFKFLGKNVEEKDVDSDEYLKNELRSNLPGLFLRNIASGDTYNNIVKALSKEINRKGHFDSVDEEAFEEMTKDLIFGHKKHYYSSARRYINKKQEDKLVNIYAYANGIENTKDFYEKDNYGALLLKDESKFQIANMLDGKELQKFSKKTLEAAILKARLDSWETEKSNLEKNKQKLSNEKQNIEYQINNYSSGPSYEERRLEEIKESEKEIQVLNAELPIMLNMLAEEELLISSRYGISFVSDDEEYKRVINTQNNLQNDAQTRLEKAQSQISSISKSKRPFFGRKKYDANVASAKEELKKAEDELGIVEKTKKEVLSDLENKRSKRPTDKIRKLAKLVGVNEFKGTWDKFLEEIRQSSESKIELLTDERSRQEADINASAKQKEGLNNRLKELLSNIEEIDNQLKVDYGDSNKSSVFSQMNQIKKNLSAY